MYHRATQRAICLLATVLFMPAQLDSMVWSQEAERREASQPAEAELTLSHVTLYSCGMGWFVYEGTVTENSSYSLAVRENEVSDILRTLNVTDPAGDVSVHLEAGTDPIRRSPTLPDTKTLGDLLLSMKGQPVRIRTRLEADIEGRLVSVELRPELVDNSIVEREMLTIVTADGLKSIALADVAELSPRREPFRDLLSEALNRHLPDNDEPRRKIEIAFDAADDRQVAVAFLRPMPMWKSAYRMYEGVFQHRGIVENTTDHDWRDVSLALVDGSPVTFRVDLDRVARAQRQQVARPVSRPEVPAPIAESMAPPEAPAASPKSDQAIMMEMGGFGTERGMAFGGGMGGGGMGGGADPFSDRDDLSADTEPGDAGQQRAPRNPAEFDRRFAIEHSATGARAAAGKAGQSLQISFPAVTVPAGQAVVLDAQPFDVASDVVSVYRAASEDRAPLLSLELENQTNMRLPAGPLSVFLERTGYAGDAMLPLLSPGVERLVGFAVDDGVRVSPQPVQTNTQLSDLRVDPSQRLIRATHTRTKTEPFLIDNRSGTERQVLIEHPGLSEGIKWSEETPEGEPTEEGWRFSVRVAHGERETLTLITERSNVTTSDFASVDLASVRRWLDQEGLVTGADRETLTDIITQRLQQAKVLSELKQLQGRHKYVLDEIKRVTVQLTGGNIPLSQTLADRYEKQLLELEDEREALEKQISELEERAEALDEQLQPPPSAAQQSSSGSAGRAPFAPTEKKQHSNDPFGKSSNNPFGGADLFGN